MIKNFYLFGKEISAYMIISLIGFFIAGVYACNKFKKRGNDENEMITFYLVISAGSLLGGHILYGFTNFKYLIKLFYKLITFSFDSFHQFLEACIFVFGGSVFYGGLLGGLLAGFVFLKKKKYDIALYTDTIAPCIPLFHIFGRLGCFLSGCCYGIKSNFGVIYHNSPISSANEVRRFPVQLMEIFLNLFLFLLLNKLGQHNSKKGKLLTYYLVIYAFCRFFIEFFRGDEYRGFILFLSTSQFISAMILFTIIIITIYKAIYKRVIRQN